MSHRSARIIVSYQVTFSREKQNLTASVVVASIEETASRYHIPKPFIGLILLPIVVCILRLSVATSEILTEIQQANAAEHVTSVWMAMKNKMELTIGICVGSSIVSSLTRFCSPIDPDNSSSYSKLLLSSSRCWSSSAGCRLISVISQRYLPD